MIEKPNIIPARQFEDSRGRLSFFNDFDMKAIRRFYVIEHPDTSIVRAWQAHKKEQKWFYVVGGSFKIVVIQPAEWLEKPGQPTPEEFILSNDNNQLLHVPGGYANGFRALDPHSKLMVFSDYALEDAGTDDYRFDKSLWYNWG